MVSNFLLPFLQLNLFQFLEKKQDWVVQHDDLSSKEAVKILEYEKNNKGYWDRVKLVKQVKEKVFPIAKVLYLGYSLLFYFDNTTSYLVYSVDTTLQVKNMTKRLGDK